MPSHRAGKRAQLVKFALYNLAADEAEAADLAQQEPKKLREVTGFLVAKYREAKIAGPVGDVKSASPAKAKRSHEKKSRWFVSRLV